jgi:sulfite reductase (NADPH) flavoprotein alpha-component
MREASKDLFALMEDGAHFFVCGDGARMARNVDAELHAIVSRERNEFERSRARD